MHSFRYDIVIPTYRRPARLARTLASIAKASKGQTFGKVIVIENGPKAGAEDVCHHYDARMDVKYIYTSTASLGRARNLGATHSSADAIVYFDDDITVMEDTLQAYEHAFARFGAKAFFGGPLLPDYEVTPPVYLLPFLPWSAREYSLGDAVFAVTEPSFLGGNMAVGRRTLIDAGGYDTVGATGAGGGMGEEMRLQQRLLEGGLQGHYLPGACVAHHVPRDRCNLRFVLYRSWRRGFGEGQLRSMEPRTAGRTLFGVPGWVIRSVLAAAGRHVISSVKSRTAQERLMYIMKACREMGTLAGFWTGMPQLERQSSPGSRSKRAASTIT